VLKRLALAAVLATLAGFGNAYITEFMKDDPGWRLYRKSVPNFRVDFWIGFVFVFVVAYLTLWWHRED